MPIGFLTILEDLVLQAPTLMVGWITVVGGCVGSFLNVVVYRWPRGMSLVSPGSHCPHCQHPIRWYDNQPVIGWLWLRGKCRDCRSPISGRYPLVEAITAVWFVAQWLHYVDWPDPDPATLRDAMWQFLAVTTFGVVLLGVVLIDYDQQAPSAKLLATGLVPPLFVPWMTDRPELLAVQTVVAFLGGLLVTVAHLRGALRRSMIGRPVHWTLFGAMIGWNTAVMPTVFAITIATAVWYLVTRRQDVHWIWSIVVVVLIILLSW